MRLTWWTRWCYALLTLTFSTGQVESAQRCNLTVEFEYVTAVKDYSSAVTACQTSSHLPGSVIIIMDSKAMLNKVLQYISSGNGNIWLGLTRSSDDGEFRWYGTNRELTYTNWGTNEPSTQGNCVMANKDDGLHWFVTDCKEKIPRLCMSECVIVDVPETTTTEETTTVHTTGTHTSLGTHTDTSSLAAENTTITRAIEQTTSDTTTSLAPSTDASVKTTTLQMTSTSMGESFGANASTTVEAHTDSTFAAEQTTSESDRSVTTSLTTNRSDINHTTVASTQVSMNHTANSETHDLTSSTPQIQISEVVTGSRTSTAQVETLTSITTKNSDNATTELPQSTMTDDQQDVTTTTLTFVTTQHAKSSDASLTINVTEGDGVDQTASTVARTQAASEGLMPSTFTAHMSQYHTTTSSSLTNTASIRNASEQATTEPAETWTTIRQLRTSIKPYTGSVNDTWSLTVFGKVVNIKSKDGEVVSMLEALGEQRETNPGKSPIDLRPSAVAIGSSAVIIIVSMIVFIIAIDVASFYMEMRRRFVFNLYHARSKKLRTTVRRLCFCCTLDDTTIARLKLNKDQKMALLYIKAEANGLTLRKLPIMFHKPKKNAVQQSLQLNNFENTNADQISTCSTSSAEPYTECSCTYFTIVEMPTTEPAKPSTSITIEQLEDNVTISSKSDSDFINCVTSQSQTVPPHTPLPRERSYTEPNIRRIAHRTSNRTHSASPKNRIQIALRSSRISPLGHKNKTTASKQKLLNSRTIDFETKLEAIRCGLYDD